MLSGRTRRLAAAAFVAAFSILVFAYLWWGRFRYDHAFWQWFSYTAGVCLAIVSHVFFADGRRELGLRLDNLRPALKRFGPPTLGVLAVAAGAAWFLGGPVRGTWQEVGIYFLWALLQQYLLQNFLRLRLVDVLQSKMAAAVAAGLLFGLYHLPNFPLVLLTLAGGVIWCLLYNRTPNLWVAATSHALIGLLLMGFFQGPLESFGVGLRAHRYDYYGGGVLVAGGALADGSPFVATLPGHDRDVSARVKIFRPDGELINDWTAFPGSSYSGYLSVADLGYGPGDEVVVSSGPGWRVDPVIRIFSFQGRLEKEIRIEEFPSFGIWTSAACGRIWAAPGPAPGAPQVLFELSPQGAVLRKWSFPDLDLANSLKGTAICSASGSPQRLLLWPTELAINPSRIFLFDLSGKETGRWDAMETTFGVQTAVLRNRQEVQVVTAPGPLQGYPPMISVFDLHGSLQHQILPHEDPAAFGATLGTVDADGDGIDEILMGEGIGPGQPSTVRVIRLDGTVLHQWQAY